MGDAHELVLASAVTSEAVILVHGHGAHPVLLEPLRRALERAGFRAVNWRYGSLRGSIETHAARLAAKATELDDDADVGRLHFVGRSMGAIVVRRALAMARPRKLGRVVLLAPPNRGARLADLGLKFFGGRLTAATELGSHPESYVNRLAPTADLDCGVIAASWDHVVSLASTHLPGERDPSGPAQSAHTSAAPPRANTSGAFPPSRPFPAPLGIARFCRMLARRRLRRRGVGTQRPPLLRKKSKRCTEKSCLPSRRADF